MSFSRAGLASKLPALTPLVGALVLAFGAAGAQAQSLTEVVQAARSVDATYLGALSSADAAHYRYEQAHSAHLPTAGEPSSNQPIFAGGIDNLALRLGANMKRRAFLQAAGLGLATTAVAKPAIAQSNPAIRWRLTATWPRSLDKKQCSGPIFRIASAHCSMLYALFGPISAL